MKAKKYRKGGELKKMLSVMKGKSSPVPGIPKVTQERLARLQQLQSTLSYYQGLTDVERSEETLHYYQELVRSEWSALREAILAGASVEEGPIRAFFTRSAKRLRLNIK